MRNGVALILAIIALAAAFAIVIGSRLSDQTITALAGAACGVGLAGPIGFGLGMFFGSMRQRNTPTLTQPSPPQVIIVPPTTPLQSTSHSIDYMPAAGPILPTPRSFTIIGDEE